MPLTPAPLPKPSPISLRRAQFRRDVQSLNNRLLEVEAKLRGQDSSAASGKAAEGTGSFNGKARAYLAVGTHGSSVAVNLEGTTGIWVDHLGLSRTMTDPSVSPGESIELQPYPSVPDAGIIDFYSEHAPLFRLPSSMVPSPPSDTQGQTTDGETGLDDDEDEEDEESDSIGITPKLVLHAFPPRHIRTEIYERLDQVHLMAPCTNIFVFKARIEDMYRWAESRSSGKRNTADQEGAQVSTPPTINFFAAAAMGLALGAVCWAAEFPPPTNDTGTSPTLSASGAGPSSSRAMPPPPVPASASNSADGPTSPANSSVSSPAHSLPRTSLRPSANLAKDLYRTAKLALSMSVEGAGYGAFDVDYMVARCLQARYLLHSHRGLGAPSGGAGHLLKSLLVGSRKKKNAPRKRKGAHDADTVMGEAGADNSETGSARTGADAGYALALAPELVSVVSDMIGNARLMGLNHDPDGPGGDRLSLYEKEMRRRLWWEINSWDV